MGASLRAGMQETPEALRPGHHVTWSQRARGRRKPAGAWPWDVRVERAGAPASAGTRVWGGRGGGAPWPFALRLSQRDVFVIV